MSLAEALHAQGDQMQLWEAVSPWTRMMIAVFGTKVYGDQGRLIGMRWNGKLYVWRARQ